MLSAGMARQMLTPVNVGEDVYLATFANGAIEFRLMLTADGRIESAGIRPQ